jgi:hypothetical protein
MMIEPELTLVLGGLRERRILAGLPSRRLATPGATARATPAPEPKI